MNIRRIFHILKHLLPTIRFLSRYGPDEFECYAHNLSLPDKASRAVHVWLQEGTTFLPYRYEQLLQKLLAEGVISQEVCDQCVANSQSAVFRGALEYCEIRISRRALQINDARILWHKYPGIVERASDPLKERIGVFDADCQCFVSSAETGMFLAAMLVGGLLYSGE
jgi:hypothetical protein